MKLELKQQLLRRQRKRYLKSKVTTLLQTLSRLSHFVQFRCWQIFLDLYSEGGKGYFRDS